MQSFVSSVNSDNYQGFITREMDKNKFLLFTDKKSTPAIYKALSKKYLGKAVFGEVRKSETSLIQKFQIYNFPTIMVLTDAENHVGETYDGLIKVDQVTKFVSSYANSKPKKVVRLEFLRLDERKVKSNQLCGDKQTDLCVLIDAGKSDAEVAQTLGKLNQVVTHFEFDKVVFAYVRSDEDPLVAESFDGNAAVIFKSKRKRYTAISMGSVEEINEAVTNVLGGGGSWNKLSNDKLKFGKHSATEEL
jgi:DnaJ family protein C protein 16